MWQYPTTVIESAFSRFATYQRISLSLDLDRAFKKLDTIKDSIVWWTGAQPA